MANENTGHELDANTVALYRLNDLTHQASNYADAADETGNYDATQATTTRRTTIQGGPNGSGDFARWWNANNSREGFDVPLDATFRSAMLLDFTIEAWIYVESFAFFDGNGTIFTVAGNAGSESEAENFLAHFTVTTGGKLTVFWETGSGSNVSVTQVTGATIALRTWTYVAITATVNGGDRDVDFFISSGTPQDSDSGTNATGGTLAEGYIGADVGGSTDDGFNGGIARIHISDIARSGTYLNANATDSTFQFTQDGNTLALYNFQEKPEIIDITEVGYHLHTTSLLVAPRIVDPHVMDGGKARSIDTDRSFRVHQREEIRTVFESEYTYEFWLRLSDASTGSDRRMLDWGGSGESLATNFLTRIEFDATGGGYVARFFGERGSGTDVGGTGTVTIMSDNLEGVTNAQQRHHYAFVFEDAGGIQRNMLVYFDGVLVDTIGPYDVPEGGTDPTGSTLGLMFFNDLGGEVDDIRLSNVARTPTQVLDSFNRGFFDGQGNIPTPPDPPGTPPVITNISPNLNTGILPETTISFDVTDLDGDLHDVAVYAIFVDSGIDEVVHFGTSNTAFGQRYLQSSTRTTITNGFRYSIRRVGGWPETPRLRVRAFDAKLNELS